MNTSNSTYITEDLFGSDWIDLRRVVAIVVVCVGLPTILRAIYSLYKEVKDGNVAPVYLINLLVSDLIQMGSSVSMLFKYQMIMEMSFDGSMFASVGFMMCMAVERYLLVAFPLWYRFRRNIRNSIIVSLLVWVLSAMTAIPSQLTWHPISYLPFAVFLLLPFPVLIFSLVGTLKALLASVAISEKEKQRIMTVLVLVLLNYMLFFLPFITWLLKYQNGENNKIHLIVSMILVQLNPLSDLLLYIVMRRGMIRKLRLTLHCCRKTAANQSSPAIAENGATEEEGEAGGAVRGRSHADTQPAAPPSPQPSPCSGSV